MIGIYKITNLINNKVYIGQSIDIEKRLKDHINGLNNHYGHNSHFQNAWDKYGEDNFKFEILEEVYNCNLLNEREIYYISYFKSNLSEYGYNKTCGGSFYMDDEYKIYLSKNKSKGSLTYEQVVEIKLCMACLMDRKEISKMYNVNPKVLTSISMGQNYDYILPELNEVIHNIKQKGIEERNKYILSLFDNGLRIIDIINKTGYSESIVSKCIHKYRKVPNKNYNDERINIYNQIIDLYNKGYNRNQISIILNQPTTTVYRYTKEGFDIHKNKTLPFKKVTEDVEKYIINEYFNKNKPIKDIAQELNLSKNTIEFYVNRYANTEVSQEIKES